MCDVQTRSMTVGRKRPRIVFESDDESEDLSFSPMESEDESSPSIQHELEYQKFMKQLSLEQVNQLARLEKELDNYNQANAQPLKYRILTMEADLKIKALAMNKLKSLEKLPNQSPDYAYEWATLQSILDLPWGKYTALPQMEISQKLKSARDFLDTVTYGQHRAKSTMLLELGRYLQNPEGHGFVLGIKGPPGVGKTTLVSQGLSQILGRPFHRIDLGGIKHADTLLGSRKVFERADMGDLAKALIEGETMNPIFFFDELDKISQTEYGREITDVLNDITDQTRNGAIYDQYLGIHLDLSRAICVFAYNRDDLIPESLRSRIRQIEIESPSLGEKVEMARTFFLPKIAQKLQFDLSQISIDDSALKKVIQHYTGQELGARKLLERIEEILLKLNWIKLTSGHSELTNYHGQLSHISFPYKITAKEITKLLGSNSST